MTPTLTAPSAGSKAIATASTPEKYPFFPDNVEFWFEAKRGLLRHRGPVLEGPA
jgi:hypothetical protein